MSKKQEIDCWVITEGMAGTENQCLGVAEALNLQPKIIKTNLKEPWKTFSPWLGFESKSIFTSSEIVPPWPDLLITSGRKAVSAARYIKKQNDGKTFTLHIQDPRVDPSQFDMVAVPYHDPTRGKNVIVTDTAPNKITAQKLADARKAFPDFEKFASSRVAVLIGGKSKAYDVTEEMIGKLISDLKNLQEKENTSLMMTVSRRTGEENINLLKEAFPQNERTCFWDGTGENPYMAYLAYADYILVTADSVSMISDALSTGKPTFIINMKGGANRIDKFHEHIREKGYARDFEGHLEAYTYKPVIEAEVIAEAVRNKMGLSGE